MSAITLLGTPAEVYRYGTQYCLLVLAYPFVMAGTVYFYLPVFWELKVSTSYEVPLHSYGQKKLYKEARLAE